MKPMKIVQKARDINRATTKEWIDEIFDDFIELKGDRFFADDAAIIGGIARFKGDSSYSHRNAKRSYFKRKY